MIPNCGFNVTSCLEIIDNLAQSYSNGDPATTKPPLISDHTKHIIEISIHVTLFMTTSLFGVITNVINITVYSRQGLKDSITLGFFALSISDLFLVIMSLFTACCYAAKVILPQSNIDFSSLHYVSSSSLRNMSYSISNVITAFLSLERCCCVVTPFKVKFIFTRSRTTIGLLLIWAFHVICYVPFFASQQLRWKPHVTFNGTLSYKLKIHFSHYRPIIEKFNYIMLGIVTPTISQIIVTVCAVILINGLRASSKFRRAASRVTRTTENKQQNKEVIMGNEKRHVISERSHELDLDLNEEMTAQGLSKKEARPVKAVIFLVAIMSLSNVPLLMITYARNLVPELNIGKAYENTFSTCYSIVYTLSSLNASLNIFVYLSSSAKFKDIFRSLLGINS